MDVAVAGLDTEFEQRVANALLPGTRLVPCSMETLEGDGPQDFAAIILGPEIPLDTALQRTKVADSEHPETPIVLVAPHDPEILREAIMAGARDVWNPQLDQADLAASLAHVLETSRHRSRLVARRRPEHGVQPTNDVIVVLSAKGGVGQTVIATNLAVGLATGTDLSVAIVDLDLQFGDVAGALQLIPEHDIADAVTAIENLPALKTMLCEHPSGLHVLCAPDDMPEADNVSPQAAADLVDLVSSQFDLTIVDASDGLSEHALAVLDLATSLLVVATPDMFVVKDTQRLLRILDELPMNDPDRRLILNHATDRSGLRRSEIEELLDWDIDVELPTNSSIPVTTPRAESILNSGRSPRRAIHHLIDAFAESASVHKNRDN